MPRLPPLDPTAFTGNITSVLSLAEQIAETLHYIHSILDMVHRDLKCANIFFRGDGTGRAVLGDFGLVYEANRESDVTQVGDHLRPRDWRPPELRRGGRVQRDPGSDINMLAGVIYQLLTGGEIMDEVEPLDLDQPFTHELSSHSIDRYTDDPRVPDVNLLLRQMFRRRVERRPSAETVREICQTIRDGNTTSTLSTPSTNGNDEAEEAAQAFREREVSSLAGQVRQKLRDICNSVRDPAPAPTPVHIYPLSIQGVAAPSEVRKVSMGPN